MADAGNDRVTLLRAEDGSFVRHMTAGLSYPLDVEECEGGWLVACWGWHRIDFVGAGAGSVDGGGVGWARLGKWGHGKGEFHVPSALALVPGLGLVVREEGNSRVQFFATPDAIAMAAMSVHRVAWMVGVARGVVLVGSHQGPRHTDSHRSC